MSAAGGFPGNSHISRASNKTNARAFLQELEMEGKRVQAGREQTRALERAIASRVRKGIERLRRS